MFYHLPRLSYFYGMKQWFIILIALFATWSAEGREMRYQYRLYLKDKIGSSYSIDRPEKFLSKRAIERRNKEGIAIDSTDLPISSVYMKRIKKEGKPIVTYSKWMNTVVVEISDTTMIDSFLQLPFVTSAQRVWMKEVRDEPLLFSEGYERIVTIPKEDIPEGDEYGRGREQIALHHGDKLHEMGFRGEGVWIAVIDAGFQFADRIPSINSDHFIGQLDLVNRKASVYQGHYHGTRVLSAMAANEPGKMVGTAPNAQFLLLRSEVSESEFAVEEDYFAAALEYADSVGVDVVTSSLGYSTFDNGIASYQYADLNGESAFITRAATMGAKKGMFMVTSAGNEAAGDWRFITFPSDSRYVLTVGAIDREGNRSSFSSVGPTADSRLKPDVVGIGSETVLLDTNGSIVTSNGTSYSTPIIAGLVACLKQALPHITNDRLMRLIKESGDNSSPNNETGRGIPNFYKAYMKGLLESNREKSSAHN